MHCCAIIILGRLSENYLKVVLRTAWLCAAMMLKINVQCDHVLSSSFVKKDLLPLAISMDIYISPSLVLALASDIVSLWTWAC